MATCRVVQAYTCTCSAFSVLTLLLVLPQATAKCGYGSCHDEKPGMLNVHMVSHTHTDPGWIITADQYYYRNVQFILDTIVSALEEDPKRRFTYVEMSFLTRWWREQDEHMKKRVRALVNEGRLDFTMGGWVMNDEAAAHYVAIIDQHTIGLEFLRTEFGECGRTRIGWQIDPFGHSREQASLFARFGFDGFFFARLDHQDYQNRINTHTMEFVWQGSPDNLGKQSDIFTGVLPAHYNYPKGFSFDVSQIYQGHQIFIHDDPNLDDYNVDKMVDNFIKQVEEWNFWFKTNHVIATMGSDYNYVDAHLNFKEIDKLIQYVNARQTNGSKVNLLYSTPSCYLKALHDDGRTWTSKSDDFFPYSHRNHTYWTGFYTSRPSQKLYTRSLTSFLQVAKQLTALARLDNSAGALDNVHKLAAAVSVAQHHDAITGTEKQVVAFDYAQRLARGQTAAEKAIGTAYAELMDKGKQLHLDQLFCHYINVSVCNYTSLEKSFEVTFYNPLARAVNITARIPAYLEHYKMFKEDGKTEVKNPVDIPVFDTRPDIAPKGMWPNFAETMFYINLPPLGFTTYFIQLEFPKKKKNSPVIRRFKFGDEPIILKGKYVEVYLDEQGLVSKLVNKVSNISTPFTQNFYYYKPFVGNNTKPEFQASGAYIFRPEDNKPIKFEVTNATEIVYWDGGDIQILYQSFGYVTQVIRVYADVPYVQFEWTVGPIPIKDGGKEIVTRYNLPGWGNKGTFYTDANGRELIKRKLNYRPTWKADIDEPVAGNYFPVDSHIHIKSGDGERQFSVLLDRSQGGSSINDGDVELMLHRRLLHDDWLGVAEALNEPGLDGKGLIARGSHYIYLENVKDAARSFRPLAQEIANPFQPSFTLSGLAPPDYVSKYKTRWSGLTQGLPPPVHLLTLERFRQNGPVSSPEGTAPYLVRFEHIYEVKEDATYSNPLTFDIKNLFSELVFVDATELTLGANMALTDLHRFDWKYKDGQSTKVTGTDTTSALVGTTITIKPMQIVTLQVNFKL